MKPLNLRANGGKTQKQLLGNNAPGKCLQAHMQHFFSTSPAREKKFAESAFFHTKIKNLSRNHWIYEPMGGKHRKLLLGNNATRKCLHAHMQHFFSPSSANEEKFAESAFFHTKIKNLSWNRWIYEPMGAKHKKLLVGNNAPGKCLHAHMQHFFSPSPAMEKKFAESAFLHTKIKNLSWNRWIYEPMGENIKNYSWATMPQASAFTPTCNISSALALLMRKNSLSQHFFIQKPNTCHETVEFTSQSRQNTKNNSWATMPLASAFRPTCNLPSALAPLGRKNSLSQHFFTQKSKTCQETIEFTSRWGKHRKLLLGNNATRKCLHAHMQHFFSPSSANEKNSLSQHFFIQKSKTCHETIEFTSQWGQNTKNYS